MIPSDKAINLIKKFEGLSLKAYHCPSGIATIGYGNTRWPDGKRVEMGQVVSLQQAEAMLKGEVLKIANRMPAVIVNQNQFDALVSFAFNVGMGNLLSSTLLKLVKANPWNDDIRDEFMKWTKITVNGQKKQLAGLVRRRKAEADLYFSV